MMVVVAAAAAAVISPARRARDDEEPLMKKTWTRWMVLLEFVSACCGAPEDDARDMGFLIIEHLAETIGTSMEEAVVAAAACFKISWAIGK